MKKYYVSIWKTYHDEISVTAEDKVDAVDKAYKLFNINKAKEETDLGDFSVEVNDG